MAPALIIMIQMYSANVIEGGLELVALNVTLVFMGLDAMNVLVIVTVQKLCVGIC